MIITLIKKILKKENHQDETRILGNSLTRLLPAHRTGLFCGTRPFCGFRYGGSTLGRFTLGGRTLHFLIFCPSTGRYAALALGITFFIVLRLLRHIRLVLARLLVSGNVLLVFTFQSGTLLIPLFFVSIRH